MITVYKKEPTVHEEKSLTNSKKKKKVCSYLSFSQLKQLSAQDSLVLFWLPTIKNSITQTFSKNCHLSTSYF